MTLLQLTATWDLCYSSCTKSLCLKGLSVTRLHILQESQPAKNRNLTRRISNLSRLNCQVSATVFIDSQRCWLFCNSKKYPVRVNPVIFLVQFLSPAIRFWLILDWKLASNILLLFYPLEYPHSPPSRELVCNKSFLQCCYVNNRRHILDWYSSVTLVVTQCFKNITLILLSFEPLLLCPGQVASGSASLSDQSDPATGSDRDAEPDATWPSPSGMKSFGWNHWKPHPQVPRVWE